MSDLISRSDLYMNDLIRRKDVLALFPTNDCSDKMVGLYERVLDIPTAYDVEKVVAELEEERKRWTDNIDFLEQTQKYQDRRIEVAKSQGYSGAYFNAIEIVNGLAEECINCSTDTSSGYCEWKWGIDYAQVQCMGDKILFGSRRLFTYCPYCGKKIKVVE